MGIVTNFELYVDGVKKFESSYSGFNIEILSDQFMDVGGVSTGHYSYDEGEYAGWTTTQGGTTPDYVVGDTFFVNGQMYLYSIPATSSGSMYLGTSTISKMYLGQNEVSKVYLGQDLVYEKQSPTTSYSVTITESNSSQSNLNYKSYLKVYDGQDTTGTLLINSTGHTALQATTVVCTTGYLYVQGYSTLGDQYTTTYINNITGSITNLGQAEAYTGDRLSVASDGSFTIETNYNYD